MVEFRTTTAASPIRTVDLYCVKILATANLLTLKGPSGSQRPSNQAPGTGDRSQIVPGFRFLCSHVPDSNLSVLGNRFRAPVRILIRVFAEGHVSLDSSIQRVLCTALASRELGRALSGRSRVILLFTTQRLDWIGSRRSRGPGSDEHFSLTMLCFCDVSFFSFSPGPQTEPSAPALPS
jgi:hypothetical protein